MVRPFLPMAGDVRRKESSYYELGRKFLCEVIAPLSLAVDASPPEQTVQHK